MKRINWLDHLVGLVVVILGISIAFYLESWKQGKQSKEQEIQYLESLISDLETDVFALDTLISLTDYISRSLVTLSNASVGRPYSKDSSLLMHVSLIQYNPPFVPQATSYSSLKASGKMDLIDDFELRRALIKLNEQMYQGAKQYDLALSEHIRDYIKPYFIKNSRYTGPSELTDDFLDSYEFRNMIFGYRYLFMNKNSFYEEVLKEVETVKDLLEDRLVHLR